METKTLMSQKPLTITTKNTVLTQAEIDSLPNHELRTSSWGLLNQLVHADLFSLIDKRSTLRKLIELPLQIPIIRKFSRIKYTRYGELDQPLDNDI